MEQSPSWEATRLWAGQQIACLLCNSMTDYRVHCSPPPGQMNLVHTLKPYWRSVLLLSSYLRLGRSSGLFFSGFPTKNSYESFISVVHATCPVIYILCDLITLTICYLVKNIINFGSSPKGKGSLGAKNRRYKCDIYTFKAELWIHVPYALRIGDAALSVLVF
jgi:hypothetical protein